MVLCSAHEFVAICIDHATPRPGCAPLPQTETGITRGLKHSFDLDHGFLEICTEGLGLIICENLINPRLSMDHGFLGICTEGFS